MALSAVLTSIDTGELMFYNKQSCRIALLHHSYLCHKEALDTLADKSIPGPCATYFKLREQACHLTPERFFTSWEEITSLIGRRLSDRKKGEAGQSVAMLDLPPLHKRGEESFPFSLQTLDLGAEEHCLSSLVGLHACHRVHASICRYHQ